MLSETRAARSTCVPSHTVSGVVTRSGVGLIFSVTSVSSFGQEVVERDTATEKRNSFFGLPIAYFSPETDWAFGVTGIYAFRLKKESITSRPSQLTLGFAYTLNKQVLIYLPYQLFAKNQVYNIYGELGYYLYSYQFFGLGNETKEEELKWLLPKMGKLSEEQEKLIERFAHRMIRKISKKPIAQVQEFAQNLHLTDNPINTVKKVFALDEVELFVPKKRVIIGTRGSKLALTQTTHMIEKLKEKEPQNEYVTKVIRTSGDEGNIEVMGAFTTAIQKALLESKVDIAVHSYKDLPIEQVPGLSIAAISDREDVRDALLSKSGKKLNELPCNI